MDGNTDFTKLSSLFGISAPTTPKPSASSESPYDDYIVDSATRNGIDPDLIRAQMYTESTNHPNATSNKGASGLMQLMPDTAKRFGVTDIYDPKQNIEGGAKYMRWLLDRFHGNVDLALAGYNAGEGAVIKYGNQIPPFHETQGYVKKIKGKYQGNGYSNQPTTDFENLSNTFLNANEPSPSNAPEAIPPQTNFDDLSKTFNVQPSPTVATPQVIQSGGETAKPDVLGNLNANKQVLLGDLQNAKSDAERRQIQQSLAKLNQTISQQQSNQASPTVATTQILQTGGQSPAPVPESNYTIGQQVNSAADMNSPRAAVLLTDPQQYGKLPVEQKKLFTPITIPGQGLLVVNNAKAKALNLNNAAEIHRYVVNNGFANLIGKVQDVGNDTSTGQTLRTEDSQGRELTSSIVSPESVNAQAQVDLAAHPNAANQEVLPTQDAVKKRLDETNIHETGNAISPIVDEVPRAPLDKFGNPTNPEVIPQMPVAQTTSAPTRTIRTPSVKPVKASVQPSANNQTAVASNEPVVSDVPGNPTATDIPDDNQVVDEVPIKLVPKNQQYSVSPDLAKDLYINQIADAQSKKYGLPYSDVKAFWTKEGVSDFRTKTTNSELFYGDELNPTQTHHSTQKDINDLQAFSVQRRNDLENQALGLIASGRALSPDEQQYFKENDVDLDALKDKRLEDYQMAQTRGAVNKEQFGITKNNLVKAGNDETVANLKASRQVGWINDDQLKQGLDQYQKFRDDVKNKLLQEKQSATSLNYAGSMGAGAAQMGKDLSNVSVSDDKVNQRIKDSQDYALSPKQEREAGNKASMYNDLLGDWGSSALHGLIGALGSTTQTAAGLLRLVGASDTAKTLGKEASKMQLTSSKLGGDDTVSTIIKIGSGVFDLPRLALLSETPLGAIGGFALSSGLESAGRGGSAIDIAKETTKGAALGAVFEGAGALSKAVINKAFLFNAPKELTAGLTNEEKEFLLNTASDAKKGLPSSAYTKTLIAKMIGEPTRLGAVLTGATAVNYASGQNLKDSVKDSTQLLLFDLMSHYGPKVAEKGGDIYAGIKNKLFRVITNGEAKIVSVTDDNQIVTYDKLNKLSPEDQDKVIDGTLVSTDELEKSSPIGKQVEVNGKQGTIAKEFAKTFVVDHGDGKPVTVSKNKVSFVEDQGAESTSNVNLTPDATKDLTPSQQSIVGLFKTPDTQLSPIEIRGQLDNLDSFDKDFDKLHDKYSGDGVIIPVRDENGEAVRFPITYEDGTQSTVDPIDLSSYVYKYKLNPDFIEESKVNHPEGKDALEPEKVEQTPEQLSNSWDELNQKQDSKQTAAFLMNHAKVGDEIQYDDGSKRVVENVKTFANGTKQIILAHYDEDGEMNPAGVVLVKQKPNEDPSLSKSGSGAIHGFSYTDLEGNRGVVTSKYVRDAETSATDPAHEAATSPNNDLPEPTAAQIEAGNYKMGHIDVNGLPITVEIPAGGERKGVDRNGKEWSRTMDQHYGYIKRSTGADGENIDVFVKDGTPKDFNGNVFVVDQVHSNGTFDEHKVMLGYDSEKEARDAYLSNYPKGWKGLKSVTSMPFDEFKEWSKSEPDKPVGQSGKDSLQTESKLSESTNNIQASQNNEEKSPVRQRVRKLAQTLFKPKAPAESTAPGQELTPAEQKQQDEINKIAEKKPRAPQKADESKHSLSTFIRLSGGIKPSSVIDTTPIKNAKQGKFILHSKGRNVEDAFQHAVDAGYFPGENTPYSPGNQDVSNQNYDFGVDHFVNAVADDANNVKKHYSSENDFANQIKQELGVDDRTYDETEKVARFLTKPEIVDTIKKLETTGEISEDEKREFYEIAKYESDITREQADAIFSGAKDGYSSEKLSNEKIPNSESEGTTSGRESSQSHYADEINESEPIEGDDSFDFGDNEKQSSQSNNFPTDLFGNEILPTHQEGLFGKSELNNLQNTKENSDHQELVDAYGQSTADYISKTEKSPDKDVSRIARDLKDTRDLVAAKGDNAKEIIENASDALDIFNRARQAKQTVDEFLSQPALGDKPYGKNAENYAKAMENGTFSKVYKQDLSDVKTGNLPLKMAGIRLNFSKGVDMFMRGELRHGEDLEVLDRTPPIYLRLGAKNYQFVVDQDAMTKILKAAHKHGLKVTPEMFKALPNGIYDPIMVAKYIDGNTGEVGLNVITGTHNDNEILVAGLKFNKKSGRVDVNKVATFHPKDLERTLDNWQRDNLIRYVNNEKIRQLPSTFSKIATVVQQAQRTYPKLLSEGDFVNKPLKKVRNSEDESAMDNLVNEDDFSNILPHVDSKIDKDGAIELNPQAQEVVRTLLAAIENTSRKNQPIIEGLFLDENNVTHLTEALDELAQTARENGENADTLDKLSADVKAASEKNGTAIVKVFDDAVRHEKVHQGSHLGAAIKGLETRYDNVRELATGDSPESESYRTAFSNWVKNEGRRWKIDKADDYQLGHAAEEIFTHLSDGDHEKLGLSVDEGTDLAVELGLRYVDARKSENSDLTTREAFSSFDDTEAAKYIDAIEEKENARQRIDQPAEINEGDGGSAAGGRGENLGRNPPENESGGQGSDFETSGREKGSTKELQTTEGPDNSGGKEQISPTSIQNEIVDQEREKRGLPPIMSEGKRSFGKVWDEATKELDNNKTAAIDLVEELQNKSRPVSDKEDALLLHRQIELQNEFDKTSAELTKAIESGDDTKRAEANLRLADLSDKLTDLQQVNRQTGTDLGRGLNARKMMAYENFSLAKMELSKRAALGGRQLNEAERQQITDLQKKIAETQKAYDDYVSKTDEHIARMQAEQAIKDISREVSDPSLHYIVSLAQKITDKLNDRAAKARERLKSKGYTFQAGIDPRDLRDFAEIGASHLARIGNDFTKWSTNMLHEFGDALEPHLNKIYDASQKVVNKFVSNLGGYEKKVKDELGKPAKPAKPTTGTSGKLLDTIKDKFETGNLDGITSQVQKLAKEFVKQGTTNRNDLIDKVHETLKTIDPDITRREAMDAISGYGKFKQLSKDSIDVTLRDLKGQMQQIAKLEDIAAGTPPAKTGLERRTMSDDERILRKQVEEAKKSSGIKTTDAATQLKMALETAKTRLVNQINDLEREITTQKRAIKTKSASPTSPEIEDLKTRRDELKAQHEEIFGKPGLSDAQRLKNWKNRTEKRVAELKGKIANEDFSSPKQRKTINLDQEGQKLKIENEKLKSQFRLGLAKDRLKNRTLLEKTADTLVKWRKGFILSGPVVLAKLSSAAAERIAITPAEEAIGAGFSKVFPRLAKLAPREGGINLRAEAKAISEGFTKGMADSWQILKTGKSDLDHLYGKDNGIPRTAIDFLGSIHGALKAPAKRAEFARSFEKRMSKAVAGGEDGTDPLVQSKIAIEAYKDSQRAIFSQDNRVVTAYKRFLAGLEEKDKTTGKTPIGSKALAVGLKTILPIVKIPTNIVAETAQYAVGSITGSVRLANAYRKGIENLKPEEADLIMRSLKKGSLGAAFLLTGFFNPQNFGGYYQPGKRDDKDVKFGSVRLFGVDIPSYLVHNPLLEALQIGSTVRRVADSKFRKKDAETEGISSGLLAGALGLIEEVPFIKSVTETSKLFDPKTRGDYLGNMAKSLVVPQGVDWAASHFDTDEQGKQIKRKPESIVQSIESGIPGLRQDVPLKEEKESPKNDYRSGKTDKQTALDELETKFNNGQINKATYTKQRNSIENLSNTQAMFQSMKASSDADFKAIEDNLKILPDSEKSGVQEVLEQKVRSKYKDKSDKAAAEGDRIQELIDKYFQNSGPKNFLDDGIKGSTLPSNSRDLDLSEDLKRSDIDSINAPVPYTRPMNNLEKEVTKAPLSNGRDFQQLANMVKNISANRDKLMMWDILENKKDSVFEDDKDGGGERVKQLTYLQDKYLIPRMKFTDKDRQSPNIENRP